MTGARFELRCLSKSYGTANALCDVSCAITAGEHLAILGRSGSGKSTALRLLAGLETPDRGMILLNDVPVSAPGRILLAPHRRGISLVFQDLALWPNLSAHANVMMGLSGLALPSSEARERTRRSAAPLRHRGASQSQTGRDVRRPATACGVGPRRCRSPCLLTDG